MLKMAMSPSFRKIPFTCMIKLCFACCRAMNLNLLTKTVNWLFTQFQSTGFQFRLIVNCIKYFIAILNHSALKYVIHRKTPHFKWQKDKVVISHLWEDNKIYIMEIFIKFQLTF